MIDPSRVLFVGYGRSVVSWYRAALPALYMGADWLGLDDNLVKAAGVNRQPLGSWDYDLIVWQQPRQPAAHAKIRELRARGVKILIDVDDYLHGVRRMQDHDFKNAPTFTKKSLESFVKQLHTCDGLIVTTEFLKQQYGKYAPRSWICKNGLDLGRYEKTPATHETVNIGWAGATGHGLSFDRVSKVVDEMLTKYDNTTFIGMGQPFGADWMQRFGQRILQLPFCSLEVYPNALSMFDIALAPARESSWYRAKSDLRMMEAHALTTPVIGSSVVYHDINHGVDGFIADTEDEWREALNELIVNDDLRNQMGKAGRARAIAEYDMNVRVQQWKDVIEEVSAA